MYGHSMTVVCSLDARLLGHEGPCVGHRLDLSEVDLVSEVIEVNILVSVGSEELLDIFLLFREEFQLSQFVSVVLSFATEVVSHFGAQYRSVFHFHFCKEFIESPCHFHDTQWSEVLTFTIFQCIWEDGISSISLLVFIEAG